MISILVNWIYIFITTFTMGFVFSKFIEKALHYRLSSLISIVLTGIIMATVYAQLFSFFYKVGLIANVVLFLGCFAAFLFWYKDIIDYIADTFQKTTKLHLFLKILLVLLWLYFTSRGYIHYDSDLYHAQSIRWIEEYGIVKGLGNIHVRFAYNSSFFALSALYSMKFFLGKSLHTVNGFIALLLSFEAVKLTDITIQKKTLLSDLARLGAFFYLMRIYDEVISPCSDYAIMCVIFLIIIRWLIQLETDRHHIAPFALLCVASVYAISLKLTAGLILLLTIKPAYLLIKERRRNEIIFYLLMGLIVLLPWVGRTAVISGYLLYPFPQLDVLNVNWKIPSELAAVDAAEIKAWGRGLNNAALANLPISEWFPNWFETMLPTMGKLIVTADIICIALFVIMMAFMFVCRSKRILHAQSDNLLVLGTIIACYIFWQLSAPLLRYGYVYVLLVVLLMVGILKDMYEMIVIPNSLCNWLFPFLHKTFILLLSIFIAVMLISPIRYICRMSGTTNYLWQADYGVYELQSYIVNGVTFYYPRNGDRVGYDAFPALPKKTNIKFRGKNISDGFTANT